MFKNWIHSWYIYASEYVYFSMQGKGEDILSQSNKLNALNVSMLICRGREKIFLHQVTSWYKIKKYVSQKLKRKTEKFLHTDTDTTCTLTLEHLLENKLQQISFPKLNECGWVHSPVVTTQVTWVG